MGLEPTSDEDFKSSAYANSATGPWSSKFSDPLGPAEAAELLCTVSIGTLFPQNWPEGWHYHSNRQSLSVRAERGPVKWIGRLTIAATTATAAAMVFAAAPVAQAGNQFITVTLPANADLTTYAWCESLGCQQPLRLAVADPAAVYAAITAIPIDPPDNRRTAAIESYGLGSLATAQAVRRLQNTYSPGASTVAVILLRSPTRPNGGLVSRVDPETATPPSNFNAFGGQASPGESVDTSFVDVGREYDGLVDSPSWPNPFSIANAVAGGLFLSDYNDTVTWQDPRCPGATCTAPATWPVTLPSATGQVYAIAQVPDPADPTKTINVHSPFPVGVAVIPTSGDQTVYYTQITRQLPLLTPLQLPFDVINSVVSTASGGNSRLQLTNPLVQVLQEPLAILVNLGYTDVDPSAGYARTLLRPGETVPFGTLPNLTPAQWSDVPGAVSRALQAGVVDAVVNPFGVRNASVQATLPAAPANSPSAQRNQKSITETERAGPSTIAANTHESTRDVSAHRAPAMRTIDVFRSAVTHVASARDNRVETEPAKVGDQPERSKPADDRAPTDADSAGSTDADGTSPPSSQSSG